MPIDYDKTIQAHAARLTPYLAKREARAALYYGRNTAGRWGFTATAREAGKADAATRAALGVFLLPSCYQLADRAQDIEGRPSADNPPAFLAELYKGFCALWANIARVATLDTLAGIRNLAAHDGMGQYCALATWGPAAASMLIATEGHALAKALAREYAAADAQAKRAAANIGKAEAEAAAELFASPSPLWEKGADVIAYFTALDGEAASTARYNAYHRGLKAIEEAAGRLIREDIRLAAAGRATL